MFKRFQRIILVIGLSILLAIPLYFAVEWVAQAIDTQSYALSMSEAYQLALKEANKWNESARLYAMTSVDEDRPTQYDGATGNLPHWNVDFVASNNSLYHIEIRGGKLVRAAEQGAASYSESLPRDVAFVDSPELAQLALNKGLKPYLGKWARGLNFAFVSEDAGQQIIVRGASQNGWPAFLTFDARGGTLLVGAERSFTGGGLYTLPVHGSLGNNVALDSFKRVLPEKDGIADDIATIAVVSNVSGTGSASTIIYAGTDVRRDAAFSERAQLLVSYLSGETWSSLDGPFGSADAILQIKVTPDGSTLFVGTTDGLYYAQEVSKDAPIAWHTPEQGLPKGHVTSLVLSPSFSKDQTVWVSVGASIGRSPWATPGSEGLFRSKDGGQSWEKVASAPDNVMDIALSPDYYLDKTLFVIGYKAGVFKSPDDGKEWARLSLEETNLNQIAVSPNFTNDRTVFTAGMQGVWRSQDAGDSWTLVTKGMTYPANAAFNVLISPAYEQDHIVLYGAFRGGLMISYDRGETWQRFDLSGLGDSTPRAIAFLQEKAIILSTYPLLGWKPLYEQPQDTSAP